MTMERATAESITQGTSIAEADRHLQVHPVIVHETDSLQVVAEAAVENAGCRVISVVDAEDRLAGLVPVRGLVHDIFLKIVPEASLGEIEDMEAVLRYAGHIGARLARDIMEPPVSVQLDGTVRDAFAKIQSHHLNGLPICDGGGRVVGYIDQLELLLVWVRATGRQRLLEPSDGDAG